MKHLIDFLAAVILVGAWVAMLAFLLIGLHFAFERDHGNQPPPGQTIYPE